MPDYQAWLSKDNDQYKIVWIVDGLDRGCYFVKASSLRYYSTKVREALQELILAMADGRNSDYPKLTRAVAAQGYSLYCALFTGSDDRQTTLAKEAKRGLDDTLVAQEDTITFRVETAIHIPWGLVYDQPVCNDQNQEIDRDNFWCAKYNVGAIYCNCAAHGIEREWDPQQFPLLFGAHQTFWSKAYEVGEVASKEWRQRLRNLLKANPGLPKFSRNDLLDSWKNRKNEYGLLAFYCHADATALEMGPDRVDRIDSAEFNGLFPRERGGKAAPPTLVFLAGCETAVGDLDAGFIDETSRTGFCGFIGTEVQVSERLTLEFVSDFLHELYTKGGSVFDIMKQLRLEHWPLSLVFSMCCSRRLRLSPPVAPAPFSADGSAQSG